MNANPTLTRRAALIGAAATSAAAVTPAAAKTPASLSERLRYHFDQLALILAETMAPLDEDEWEIRVNSRRPRLFIGRVVPSLEQWLSNADTPDLIEYHALRLGEALQRQNGGRYKVALNSKLAVVLQWDEQQSGVFLDRVEG